ncbi:HTH domain-containing protein [Nocardia aobensis]|uniref:HTH domain-containing protein n=1 Tax=Nocardia aobensis TaxID=257277 RepID=A0ABW6P0G0_9NOCA
MTERRLGVSEQTVRRDVDRQRDLGCPVRAVKGPDGGTGSKRAVTLSRRAGRAAGTG